MAEPSDIARHVENMARYGAGFVTDIESDKAPKGLNEEIVRFISAKKKEPEWLLAARLKAFEHWKKMPCHSWVSPLLALCSEDYPRLLKRTLTRSTNLDA